MSMDHKAWFCPSCQKHHAPHVDTCPGLVDAVPFPQPMPWAPFPKTIFPHPWEPNPGLAPIVTCGGLETVGSSGGTVLN